MAVASIGHGITISLEAVIADEGAGGPRGIHCGAPWLTSTVPPVLRLDRKPAGPSSVLTCFTIVCVAVWRSSGSATLSA